MPKVSICVPIHDMENGDRFLWRLVNSLTEQTFKDWELIITKEGNMAENTNAAINRARGEYIKILYLDDYFSHPYSLIEMLKALALSNKSWLIAGTNNNLKPYWTEDIHTGNNRLGSPSALLYKNDVGNPPFDESMSWLLDCDFYKKMHMIYGEPEILEGNLITIGEHDGQMTNILTQDEKIREFHYLEQKYGN